MKRISVAIICVLFGILLGIGLGLIGGKRIGWRTTLTRLSPDETLRVLLAEPVFPSHDRNIQVQLEDLVSGESTVILSSLDVGSPAGSERLIWSRDGKWILLVGRHFFVKEDLFVDNGDQLYFLYEIPAKHGWINSAESIAWPRLTAKSIDGIEFTEPIRLKPR